MSKVIHAPNKEPSHLPNLIDVFLAGSIEMGKAEDWQTTSGARLSQLPCVGNVFNPRRPDWDSSWAQHISDPQFNTQVNWELDHIEIAPVVFFHFEPGTQSPITLAELGYVLGRLQATEPGFEYRKPTVVVNCPDGFWRQGNVEIMCHRAGIKIHRDLSEALNVLETEVWKKHLMFSNVYSYFPFQCAWETSPTTNRLETVERGTRIPKGWHPPEREAVNKKATKSAP